VGLARREQVLLFSDSRYEDGPTTWARARARLEAFGAPAEPARLAGQFTIVQDGLRLAPGTRFDPAEKPAGFRAATAAALAGGWTGLRVIGDMHWALDIEPAQLIDLEHGLNDVYAELPCVGLCEYDRRNYPRELLDRLARGHHGTALDRPGALHTTPLPEGLRIAGDADLTTREQFRTALRQALSNRHRPRTLDLMDLSFLSAQCATELVGLASRHPDGAGITVRCGPSANRSLRLAGASGVPRLHLTGEAESQ
jgi:anti-anti-sigma regulatory factor